MGFQSDKQRKAFFAQKQHLVQDLRQHQATLERQKKVFAEKEEVERLKKRIGEVKLARRKITIARFKISPVGKAAGVAGRGVVRVGRGFGRGVGAVARFEKKHGKAQIQGLKKVWRTVFN